MPSLRERGYRGGRVLTTVVYAASLPMNLDEFTARWIASGAEERANKDTFLLELCDVLGVPRPDPKTGDPARDRYVFEMDAMIAHEGAEEQRREDGSVSSGRVRSRGETRVGDRVEEARDRAEGDSRVGARDGRRARASGGVCEHARRSATVPRGVRHRVLLRSVRRVRWHRGVSAVAARAGEADLF